ncbi:MAG: bifunctional serine/threonine-protein kinase/formylglycine-generating enzyme family protein [Gammaproteobacteria bacterium]|nr:bifunctional serine/threonine-protein kinase/formylglycine-generating enzyme family protein [Gammaproteobacteria bacterium]
MASYDDKKNRFPDYTSSEGNITEPDKTVIRKSTATSSAPVSRDDLDQTITGADKTVIRKGKPAQTDSTIQRAANKQSRYTDQSHGQNSPRGQDIDKTRIPSSDSTRVVSNKPQNYSTSPLSSNLRASQGVGQHRILKNRFLLEKVLGVGGMGVVYKAKDRLKVEAKDRDPYVAIKVLSEEFKTHPDAFISLQRESRKAQRLAQPNIVKVYDFDRDGDDVFMTMEYMEGKPLDQLIKQYNATGLPWDDTLEIIKGMCSALGHAHAENIIHSDFKPGNIFVTNSGMAKIFDFGIARAVTNVDRREGKVIDKTVFDAGSLGALTPAYASMEMLQGKTPDIRDDIYALGCIVYEILTGKHPFNKLPADEACEKNLKPKKITSISKRQWKAVEKSLAFDRANRLSSAEEFYQLFTEKFKTSYLAVASVALVAILATTVYVVNTKQSGISEYELRNEMEFTIRYDLYKSEIKRLLDNPSFTIDWEEDLWREVSGVEKILSEDDVWFISLRRDIFILYIEKIREMRANSKLARTKILIQNAERYTDDARQLDGEREKLAKAVRELERQKQLYADNIHKETKQKLEQDKKNKEVYDAFNVALKNVNKQLLCQSRLSMRDFDIAIKKLRSLDYDRYLKAENRIVKSLSACIVSVGERFPERAVESKKYAIQIFGKNSTIASIKIKPKDACDTSLAGLGKFGKRGVCRDRVKGLGEGPDLVVVPRGKSLQAFAIGKYEITIGEINRFCKKTEKCKIIKGKNENWPATGISISTVKDYMRWLSRSTGRKYRLPTKSEWVYASNSTNRKHDSNRNCQLSSRGIEKGGVLVNATTGRQNSWGLVNYLGNAQEWVFAKGGKLVAAGGSYRDSMNKCNVTTWMDHTGKPDSVTGFRLVRELKE